MKSSTICQVLVIFYGITEKITLQKTTRVCHKYVLAVKLYTVKIFEIKVEWKRFRKYLECEQRLFKESG